MARKVRAVRDPMREWPDPTPVATPVSFRGMPTQVDEVKRYFEEWSRANAEANHVETLEEANDFSIQDEEDDDFFHGLTPYEMHDLYETEVANGQMEDQEGSLEPEAESAESNETADQGANSNPDSSHDQSAPDAEPAAKQIAS